MDELYKALEQVERAATAGLRGDARKGVQIMCHQWRTYFVDAYVKLAEAYSEIAKIEEWAANHTRKDGWIEAEGLDANDLDPRDLLDDDDDHWNKK